MKYLFYIAVIFLGFHFTRINPLLGIALFIAFALFASKRLKKEHQIIGLSVGLFCMLLTFSMQPQNAQANFTTIGVIVEAKTDYYIIRTLKGRFYVSLKNNDLEYLDIIKLSGTIENLNMHAIESNFDFKQYLNDQGVFNELKVSEMSFVYKRLIRNKEVAPLLCTNLSNEACMLTQNLVLAKNEKSEINNYASILGIAYLFTLSGYNLLQFKKLFTAIIKYLGVKKHRELIVYLMILPYCLLTLHRFAVLKFLFLGCFQFINQKTIKERYLFILFCSFVFFLILDIYLIYQLKFYLPYLMSLAIFLTRQHIKKDLPSVIINLFLLYLLVSILVLNEVEVNIVAFFLRIILMPILFITFIASILTILNIIPSSVMNSLARIFTNSLESLSKLDLSILIGKSDLFLVASVVVLFIIYLYLLALKNNRQTKMVVLSFLCILLTRPLGASAYFKDAIYFIDVGQGDSILFHNKHVNILLDTGGNIKKDIAKTTLIPFFKKHRISKLDAVIISHNDFDHNGALNSLLNEFNIKRIITSKDEFPYNINDLQFINLNYNLGHDDNDNSLVIYLEFMQHKWLFMGDASKKIELDILKNNPQLDIDYLKIGHHGSNTSSDKAFLKSITPDEAIISAGFLNTYGHPHEEVLDMLKSLNIKIRRTDIEGTIVYQKYSF